MKTLHIYGQYAHHSDATILGDRESLQSLYDSLGRILSGDEQSDGFNAFTTDGEGYTVTVVLETGDVISRDAPLPYTADYAADNRKFPDWLLLAIRKAYADAKRLFHHRMRQVRLPLEDIDVRANRLIEKINETGAWN